MPESPSTRLSLLVRIRDRQDQEAWARFVEVYAPLVYGFVRKRGLQDADAADVTQDVLRSVAGAAGRLEIEPQAGSFRRWLMTVTLNKLRNLVASRRRHTRDTGDTGTQRLLEAQPARPSDDAAVWDREYEQRLFAWAAEQVRGGFTESTWQAFWATAVDGKPAAEVAKALGLSVGAVYISKSRVLARLRGQIRELEGNEQSSWRPYHV